jgi:hypothetical protein
MLENDSQSLPRPPRAEQRRANRDAPDHRSGAAEPSEALTSGVVPEGTNATMKASNHRS